MPSTHPQRRLSLLQELRRRRVFRAVLVYVAAALAALQGVDVLVPALRLPGWTMSFVVVLAIAGLPVAIGLAWVFDLGPGGVHRTTDVDSEPAAPGDGASARRGHGADVAPVPRTTLAVVPFLDLSADAESEIFADGITEDVIAHLSKMRALKVISRSSVLPFRKRERTLREVGRLLGAGTILDGSVRRIGDRVRIVAQLVDAETEQHLWAETYDRELTDIFAIQTDVALHIAEALEAELSPEERRRVRRQPTADIDAYRLYLQGRHWFSQYTAPALQRAIEYYERAVAADPEYALAHAGVAMAYAELAETDVIPTDEARRKALAAAERAVRIDPGLGDARCIRAHLRALWEYDWAGAEAEFRRAIELSPSSSDAYDLYGRMCSALRRFDEALALQRRARELDPLAHRLDVATTLLRMLRSAEAEAEARRALEFDPEHDRAHATLGWALIQQGRTEAGIAAIRRAGELSPADTQWLAQLGQALAMSGHTEEAREIARRLESRPARGRITRYHTAFVYTGLGEHERALDLLEQALEERAAGVYGIYGSFLFAPLREHPRYRALLRRMNIPTTPQADAGESTRTPASSPRVPPPT